MKKILLLLTSIMLLHAEDSVEKDEQIVENYRIIRNEIENYGNLVSKKKEIIILTKSDLVCKNKITD